jgi:hypothetical protein
MEYPNIFRPMIGQYLDEAPRASFTFSPIHHSPVILVQRMMIRRAIEIT